MFATLAGGITPLLAQTTDAHIKELIRAAAERIGAGQAAIAEPPQTPAGASGSVVHLSLDDAVKLALDRNLDIAVQRLNPQTFDFSIASLQAAYKPTLTSQVATQSVLNPPTNTLQGVPTGQNGHYEHDDHRQRRHRPEHSLGRRRIRVDAEQQQANDEQHHVDAESLVQYDLFHASTPSRSCAASRST